MSVLLETNAQRALAVFESLVRSSSRDARAFCELGPVLDQSGYPAHAKICFHRAVDLLREAARRDEADEALAIETDIYLRFVRPVETEEHYARCFELWNEDLIRLGGRARRRATLAERDPRRVAFVLPTGYRLGHTEVLVRYLRAYLAPGEPTFLSRALDRYVGLRLRVRRPLQPSVYVYDEYNDAFARLCRESGIQLVLLKGEHPELARQGTATLLLALRDRLRVDRIGCTVWVSTPASVSYAFAMGLAPVQILWALRFHPVTSPYVDGYISYGRPGQREQVIRGQAWRTVPPPLAIEAFEPDSELVRRARARFLESFLFGTIAREEKIRSPEFLEAVAMILKQRPEAGFIWTGRNQDPSVEAFFAQRGVGDRCHYVGWIDSTVYARVIDVFLETFPLGCGITGYQALGAGTPLLSFYGPKTVYGMRFLDQMNEADVHSRRVRGELRASPILCATSTTNYIELGCRLAADREFRSSVGASGRAYFERELTRERASSSAFFGYIKEVIDYKASVRGFSPG